jgi:ABC-type multidrug transport system fused ATPase/permease subunit
MTLAILPLIPVFVLTRKHFRKRLERDADTVQHNQIAWSSFLQEHLSSIVAIQLLRREERQERMAFRLLGTAVRSLTRLFRTGVSFTFFTSLTIGLAMASVIGYGGLSVLAGTLTVGGLVAFYTYLAQLFEPLSGVAETYARAQKTFASIRRVQGVLALEPAIKTCRSAIKFPQDRPSTIEVADVRFEYPRGDGLLCISRLEIPAGEHVAVVGENGAGKSTLAKLMARLYDVDSGSISVAGHDVERSRSKISANTSAMSLLIRYSSIRHCVPTSGWGKAPPQTPNLTRCSTMLGSRLGRADYRKASISGSAREGTNSRAVNDSAWELAGQSCSDHAS